VYRLLLYFLLHSGRLISHEELFDTVWDGRIVGDSALRLAVNSLRNVLHDENKSPQYIATVCKRGYRFLAEVTVKEHYRIAEVSETSPLHYRPQAQTSPARREYAQELAELQGSLSASIKWRTAPGFFARRTAYGQNRFARYLPRQSLSSKTGSAACSLCENGGITEPFMPLLEALERRCCEPYGRLLIERLNYLAPTWLFKC
jgi:DNA-binding winged helix-turn-helix (wHTH) protein